MQTEIEAKFLNIDKNAIREALRKAGANLKQAEILSKRKNFDYPDQRLRNTDHAWVRVRDEGNKTTLSYKRKVGSDIHGVQELMVEVSDFDDTCKLLKSLGLAEKNFQENLRESWTLGSTQIDIDSWPWIPPFIEIEGETEEAVIEAAKALELDWADAKFGSALTAFQGIFEVTGEQLHYYPKITFDTEPPTDWKRK